MSKVFEKILNDCITNIDDDRIEKIVYPIIHKVYNILEPQIKQQIKSFLIMYSTIIFLLIIIILILLLKKNK